MERLTSRDVNGKAIYNLEHDDGTYIKVQEVCDRLADYEGTGLEPEEVAKVWNAYSRIAGKGVSFARLQELIQAEKEGRLVEYVPGDIVYDRFGMEWTVRTAEILRFDGPLRYLYRCGHPGTDDYCALYADEILTHEEAEAALEALKGGEGK